MKQAKQAGTAKPASKGRPKKPAGPAGEPAGQPAETRSQSSARPRKAPAARSAGGDQRPHAGFVDQNGRALGPRAQATRRRLLDAGKALLDEQSLRELRVSDIARRVGTSPATFYQYFKDVEDLVLCLAREASREMHGITQLIEGDWQGEAGLERGRALASAFIDHWDAHHAPLRVRNMAADEGDTRFLEVRSRAMAPLLAALAGRIEAAREQAGAAGGTSRVHPHAAAAAMAAILERLAAYHRELEDVGVTRDHLVETTAHIVQRTLTETPAPSVQRTLTETPAPSVQRTLTETPAPSVQRTLTENPAPSVQRKITDTD